MVVFSVNLRSIALFLVIVLTICVLALLLAEDNGEGVLSDENRGDIVLEASASLPLFSKNCHNGRLQQGWEDLKTVLIRNLGDVGSVDITNFLPDLEGFGDVGPIFDNILKEAMDSTRIDLFVVIEIGSFKGKSTIHIANACRKLSQSKGKKCVVIAVDLWLGTPQMFEKELARSEEFQRLSLFREFYSNLRVLNLTETVYPLRLSSNMAAHVLHCFRIAADIIYINGDHEYELVLRDLKTLYPLVRRNGFLFGEGINSNWPGVDQAVLDFSKIKRIAVVPKGRFWTIKKSEDDAQFFRL